MSQLATLTENPAPLVNPTPPVFDCLEPDWDEIDRIVEEIEIEDGAPVDNIISERQMRLLTSPLYDSWQPDPDPEAPDVPRNFIAAANVGVFSVIHEPPLVPDVFLSLDVVPFQNLREKRAFTYFIWEYGKPPDVVVEVVSRKPGGELDRKLRGYARMGVAYYVVFDPLQVLSQRILQVFEIMPGQHRYSRRADFGLPHIGLSLAMWQGTFEGVTLEWIRWCDRDGNLIALGAERAALQTERANQETERANQETERANQEAERAARLAAKLREMGFDPSQV